MNNEKNEGTRMQRLGAVCLLALAALLLFLTNGCAANLRNSELEKFA
jgi:hypothetical protein